MNEPREKLINFGFTFNESGVHTRRTMMLEELSLLLNYVKDPDATKEEYIRAICEDNCLGKRSGQNRKYAAKYLTELYSLDRNMLIFRVLNYFWTRDEKARPLLALLCAYTRDALLRMSATFILNYREGDVVNKIDLEEYINKIFPDRYSDNTLASVARNLIATWTKSGHLKGRYKKIRSKPHTTPGSTIYALFLSYLNGSRGELLLNTEYTRLLDCSTDEIIELSEAASRRGWISFKHIDNVIEVQFNGLLTKEEMEWVYE